MSVCGYPYEEADEYAEFWREKVVTARKAHYCCECNSRILPGEVVGYSTCLFEGQWHTQYRCPACLILIERAATVMEECPQWGMLPEFLERAEDHTGQEWPTVGEHRLLWESK